MRIFFRHPLVGNSRSPLVVDVWFCWALWLSDFFKKLSCVVITIIEIYRSSVDNSSLSQFEVICGHEFTIIFNVFLTLEEYALRDTGILCFFLINGNRVVLKIEEDFYLSISLVFSIFLYDTFFEVTVEA